jgi:hypothetical protein
VVELPRTERIQQSRRSSCSWVSLCPHGQLLTVRPSRTTRRNAVFRTPEGTAYVVLGNSGLTECASLVANISDLNRLVDIVTEVCQSLEISYKDDTDGPKGKFHRYESKDGTIRASITANPPELVIVVQSKVFKARDNSPMTTALWK